MLLTEFSVFLYSNVLAVLFLLESVLKAVVQLESFFLSMTFLIQF